MHTYVCTVCTYIKTSGSKSQPRKVELTCVHKQRDNYCEYFTHNNGTCKHPRPTKQPYRIDIFIS